MSTEKETPEQLAAWLKHRKAIMACIAAAVFLRGIDDLPGLLASIELAETLGPIAAMQEDKQFLAAMQQDKQLLTAARPLWQLAKDLLTRPKGMC